MNRRVVIGRQSDSYAHSSETLAGWYLRAVFLCVLVVILALGNARAAFANSHTWDTSGPNGYWSNATNWVYDAVPESEDSLVFTGSAFYTPTNDIPSLSLAKVSFINASGFGPAGLPVTLSGDMNRLGTGTSQWSIDTTLTDASHEVVVDSGDLTLNGIFSGDGSLTATGTGGSIGLRKVNLYSGGTVASGQSWLYLLVDNSIPYGDGKGGLTVNGGATVDLNNHIATVNRLAGNGTVINTSVLTIGNGFDGDQFSGVIKGSGSVVKVGMGEQALSGACSYTGPTSINAGTLLLGFGGSTSQTSTVAVQSGARLEGVGSAAGTVTVNGTIAPGGASKDPIGTLHTGSEIWEDGGRYEFDVAATDGTPGEDWDLLEISGSLTVAATDDFTIKLSSIGDLTEFDPSTDCVWRIANFTGASNQFNSAKFSVDAEDFAPDLQGGTFSVVQAGNGQAVDLVFTPEARSNTVHYQTDGTPGSSVDSMTQTVATGGDAAPVAAAAPAGYRFVNWTGTGTFEATTDNPMTVSNVTADMTITANFAVDRPAAPYSVTWSPVKGGTLIQWAGSPGAMGYQVWLGTPAYNPASLGFSALLAGRLLGTAGPSTCSLFVAEYLGPNSTIYVVALGDAGWTSAPAGGVFTAAVNPVQMGTVRFTGNSSKLTRGTKTALKRYASLLAAQGFTSVKVSGYTAKYDHGSKSFRRKLSLARAKKVKAYLAAELKRLGAHVTITTAGYGGASPVGSNSSKSGAAKNRRAELLLK